MKRILFSLFACTTVGVLAASPALAHGGQFRGPGGAVPPGLREPGDPTPPPPPTSTPPPTTNPDPTPTPAPGPITGAPPPVTGVPLGPTTNGVPETGRPKAGQIGYENWTFWWGHNNDPILHIKESIYTRRASAGSALGDVGGVKGGSTDSTRATEKQVRELIIPTLYWVMDPKNGLNDDTESAAYIALAKVTQRDPADIEKIIGGIYDSNGKPVDRPQMIRESAALSLGLLRRSEQKKQFDAKDLDRVRDLCFQIFEDEGLKAGRTQGFAMLALGLLGDQPTNRGKAVSDAGGGLFYAPDDAALHGNTTQRLMGLLRKKYSSPDLPVSVMIAVGLQDPATVTPEMLDVLKECALKGKIYNLEASAILQSYAALALGRVGTKDYVQPLLNCLNVRGIPIPVKQSAAIALGQLGRKVDGAERAALASALVKAVQDSKDESTRNFGLISIGYLLEADVHANRTEVMNAKGVKPFDFLLQTANDGRMGQRTFAALSLGLVGRAIGDRPQVIEYGEMKTRAIEALRSGIDDQKMDKRSRAAFAIGSGMLEDGGASKRLVEIVGNKNEDKELRGYAAVALGMLGSTGKDVVDAIHAAMKEHSSEELRAQTAIALGMLQVTEAVVWLKDELKDADSQNVAGQIVLALAKIGDERSIKPLVDIIKESGKPNTTKALACVGLGLIGDLEMLPSLTRISKDINYRASTDVVAEVLTIL